MTQTATRPKPRASRAAVAQDLALTNPHLKGAAVRDAQKLLTTNQYGNFQPDDRRLIDEIFARMLVGNYDDHLPWQAVQTLRLVGTREVLERAAEWCRSDDPLKRARGADVLAPQLRRLQHPERAGIGHRILFDRRPGGFRPPVGRHIRNRPEGAKLFGGGPAPAISVVVSPLEPGQWARQKGRPQCQRLVHAWFSWLADSGKLDITPEILG